MHHLVLIAAHAALTGAPSIALEPAPEAVAVPVAEPVAPIAFVDDAARTPEHLISDDRRLSYTYIEFSYLNELLDDAPSGVDDPDGFTLTVSAAVTDSVFITAGGTRAESDVFGSTVDFETMGFTVGAHTRAGNGLDAFAEVGWAWAEVDGPGVANTDDDGLVAGAGLRYRANQVWETLGAVGYEDIGADDSLSFTAGVLAHVAKRASVVGTYTFGEDSDVWSVGLRVDL